VLSWLVPPHVDEKVNLLTVLPAEALVTDGACDDPSAGVNDDEWVCNPKKARRLYRLAKVSVRLGSHWLCSWMWLMIFFGPGVCLPYVLVQLGEVFCDLEGEPLQVVNSL
jgi:hypothetical protein